MKLATGLWVWGSLLVATGTVQPSASQSAPFFLSRAFSGSLSGIASGGARCSGRGRQELVSGGSFLLGLGRGKKRKKKKKTKTQTQKQTQIELLHLFSHRDVSRLLLSGLPGVQGCSGWSAGREPGLAPERACVQWPARLSRTRRGHPGRGARPWQLERTAARLCQEPVSLGFSVDIPELSCN
ncbi:hypothetical protein LEMLEM_LOCUS18606 [Lemmus lemmus]